ncbi:MAG: lysoplasmalogenase [Candidatus Marinimicrobia bacterium]|nr:lysoplasmalogenase [Candidatus Neomarinimicrobiota bacterium]MCF7850383.1 lysoplasmalogenase [Candidatus Neomarinimicrobiota bacterium]MCF7904985.1 lysoplasmalogenase [Candidatus Neomarinimicrobiota bacterium]
MDLLPYLIAVLILSGIYLIRAEVRNERKLIYIFKPIATISVIIIAALALPRGGAYLPYSIMILLGLLFSFFGDMALMFPRNLKAFRLGLANFLIAHLVYSVAFLSLGEFSEIHIIPIAMLAFVSGSFFMIIKQGLASMKIPVISYIIIITLMVGSAISIQGAGRISCLAGTLVLMGAILFYVSDLILAANRFWKPWKYNRISLAFYYSGQLLIALSPHHLLV